MHRTTRKQGERGISLIEVLLAIGIFTLFVASLGTIGVNGVLMTSDAVERYRAVLFAEEGVSALRSMRADSFSSLVSGTYGVLPSGGSWTLSPLPNVADKFTRTVTIAGVGTGRVRATVQVVWNQRNGLSGKVEASTFLHQLYGSRWIQTTTADFQGGAENGVQVTSAGDGAVELESSGDWTLPTEFITHDILGPGTLSAMTESGGVLYLASSAASTKPLVALDISDISTGVWPQLLATDSGATIKAMLVIGEYLYLATDGDAGELIVLRKKDFSVVRTVNLAGNADALALSTDGTALYLSRANSTDPEVYKFDVTNPEVSTPTIQSVQITGSVNALAMTSGYLVLGTAVSSSEVIVLRTSDLGTVNTLNLSANTSVLSLAIVNNMLYVGRAQAGSREISEINITNPLGALSVANDADLAGSVLTLTGGADGRLYVGLPLPASEVVAYAIPGLTAPATYNASLGAGASSLLVVGPYVYVGLGNNDPELVVLRGGTGQWISPLMASTLDMPSNADGSAVAVSGTFAYHGTQNSSGGEFSIINVSNVNTPIRVGSLEIGAAVNDIVIVGPYAYLATTDNAREIVIVNIASSTAPMIVGSYNTPGNSDGSTIAASGTQLFLGTLNNAAGTGREAYLFSTTVATAPALQSSQEVGEDVHDGTFAPAGYIVLATANNAKELLVLNASNPLLLSEASAYNTSGNANALAVSSLQSTIALGTEDNGASHDALFFTLNTVTGTVAFVSGLNLSADNESVALAPGRAFLGNNIGGQGLTIVDIPNLTTPQMGGSLAVAARVNAIALDAVYAYLGTTHNAREFAIASPNPLFGAYAGEGWFTSSPFSVGTSSATWGQLDWTNTGTTTLQIRTSSTALGLSAATWVGPSGISGGTFATSGGAVTPSPTADGTTWIQYRAQLSGNGSTTPQLTDVSITYN